MKIKTKILFKTKLRLGFFVLLSLALLSCKEKLTGLQIIEKSIEAHGGIESWRKIKQLSFDKETTLFNEDSSVELRTEQFQLFQFGTKLFGKIEWQNNGNNISIMYDGEKISKSINDSVVDSKSELEKASNAFWAVYYVACKPFDLIDENADLLLVGETDLEGKRCYVVDVLYKNDTAESDRWSYIIDAETFKVVANKVVLKDHTSWVENLTFDTSTPLIFNAHRKSYRLNEAGEKTYLRAEYFYKNFKVEHITQ
ncbi:MAG: hypothetical protein L3J25_04300 [Flavobacteriaceae bacterium]|nr:hypothetical protein [Flavobacteriaceae bacterium]